MATSDADLLGDLRVSSGCVLPKGTRPGRKYDAYERSTQRGRHENAWLVVVVAQLLKMASRTVIAVGLLALFAVAFASEFESENVAHLTSSNYDDSVCA